MYPRLKNLFATRIIALVGNAPVSPQLAREIDAHEQVIRFNRCLNFGDAGTKTDVLVLCNTGGSAKAFVDYPAWLNWDAIRAAGEVWFPSHPETLPPCEDRDAHNFNFGPQLAGMLDGKPWQYLPADLQRLRWKALDPFKPEKGKQPSTGLTVMVYLGSTRRILNRLRVSLYGFSHEGWEGHPWAAEKAYVDAQRWIRRRLMQPRP